MDFGKEVLEQLKKNNGSNNASSAVNDHRRGSIPVAVLLTFVVLLSSSGAYAGASFLAQQAPGVTVTSTVYTTTTLWTTSMIWSTMTETVEGILTTIEYTTSTSTITVTSSSSALFTLTVNVRSSSSPVYGASVFLDGVLRGTTNSLGSLVISGVTAGSHTVTVTKSGFRTASQAVYVAADTSITIKLSSKY